MSRRFACHKLYVSADSCYTFQVLEIDAEGIYLRHYALTDEQPATVWKSGITVLLPLSVVPRCGESLYEVWKRAERAGCPEKRGAWHLPGLSASHPHDLGISVWEKIS